MAAEETAEMEETQHNQTAPAIALFKLPPKSSSLGGQRHWPRQVLTGPFTLFNTYLNRGLDCQNDAGLLSMIRLLAAFGALGRH